MLIIWLFFSWPGSLALLIVTKEKGLRNFHFDKVSQTSSEILLDALFLSRAPAGHYHPRSASMHHALDRPCNDTFTKRHQAQSWSPDFHIRHLRRFWMFFYSRVVGAQGGAHFQYLEVYHGTPLELVTIKRLHYNSGGEVWGGWWSSRQGYQMCTLLGSKS